MSAHVESVNVGTGNDVLIRGRTLRTGIDKRSVDGPVRVGRLGIDGDRQFDTRDHGGVDQAVYVYAGEDLDDWAVRLDRALAPGSFGENLTVRGIDVNEARIGERWRIGGVVVEVADVRTPCATFQAWLQEPKWIRRFSEIGRCGAYLRVIEEGTLQAGDTVEVVQSRPHDVTVGLVFQALMTDRSLLPRLLVEPRLRESLRADAEKYLATQARTAATPDARSA
jgi:MOSC domain-containing protein YiiM